MSRGYGQYSSVCGTTRSTPTATTNTMMKFKSRNEASSALPFGRPRPPTAYGQRQNKGTTNSIKYLNSSV